MSKSISESESESDIEEGVEEFSLTRLGRLECNAWPEIDEFCRLRLRRLGVGQDESRSDIVLVLFKREDGVGVEILRFI